MGQGNTGSIPDNIRHLQLDPSDGCWDTVLDGSPSSLAFLPMSDLDSTSHVSPREEKSPFSPEAPPASPLLAREQALDTDTMLGRHTTVLPEVTLTEGELKLVERAEQRYDTIGHLGEGGAGEVMLVHDNDIARRVAMKRIKEEVRDSVQMARFVDEVKTVGKLDHPNIVPIHDVGVDETGQHYFTMKYVEGETLEEIIQKLRDGDPEYHRRYNYERRTQLFIEVLHAIHFAHKKGIVHRDIKPANIMVGAFGEVMVMDWGIAKGLSGGISVDEFPGAKSDPHPSEERHFETAHGTLIGTPAYMAPEQLAGQQGTPDPRSDLYSLTLTFYEFLNLHHPLSHKTSLQEVLWGVLNDDIPDAESIKNKHQGPVPRELCFFLRTGLKKNPAERFQSIEEMIDRLQGNLEGRICVHCPSTFLKRGSHMYGHYLDNHRVLGVVWFCLLLIVLGVGLWQTASFFLQLLS